MKKVLLIDASPRKNGNSEVIVDTIATDLVNCEVTVFKMRAKNYHHCTACAACQGRDTQYCVQKDDISALLNIIDKCDAILMATPIYNHQVSSMGRIFIERLYPFFNVEKKNMSNTTKFGKKAALVCSFWGGPQDIYQKYAYWTVETFSQIGAEQTKAVVFGQIPERGEIRARADYMQQVHEVSKWLLE